MDRVQQWTTITAAYSNKDPTVTHPRQPQSNHVDLTADSSDEDNDQDSRTLQRNTVIRESHYGNIKNAASFSGPSSRNHAVAPEPKGNAPLRPLDNTRNMTSSVPSSSSYKFYDSNRLSGMPPIKKSAQTQSSASLAMKPPGGFATSTDAFKSVTSTTSGQLRPSGVTVPVAPIGVKARIAQQMETERQKLGIPFAVPRNAPLGSKHAPPQGQH